ncbi:MAG: hypothetical protein JWM96_1107 [Alphaproteobacteria bacterium]|nr:hypothetical protein [Alphaproteobacteria bacterium]
MPQGRLGHLLARKAQLDAEVNREHGAMLPDTLRLAALKRRKLLVKEEIEKLHYHGNS